MPVWKEKTHEGSQAKTGGEKAGRERNFRRIGSILIETGAK
jgi:hypothetical protein